MVSYGENSPSLWPTMSSVTVNSWYIMPLCTWNFKPTKFGSMVAERAWVRIGATVSPGLGRTIGRLGKCQYLCSGLDCRAVEGLRHIRDNVGSYRNILLASWTIWCDQFDLPFQAERFKSARVGNMDLCLMRCFQLRKSRRWFRNVAWPGNTWPRDFLQNIRQTKGDAEDQRWLKRVFKLWTFQTPSHDLRTSLFQRPIQSFSL